MSEKRSDVIPIIDSLICRMLVSMVDVLCADLDDTSQMCRLLTNTLHFLRAGGHFLLSTKASYVFTNSENEITFEGIPRRQQNEYKVHEIIGLEQTHKGRVMAVGCFRPLDSEA
ncbi:rRNA/tRNA 2'-O-methyltransferase fibrillarin-like protein 1 [Linum perenne]